MAELTAAGFCQYCGAADAILRHDHPESAHVRHLALLLEIRRSVVSHYACSPAHHQAMLRVDCRLVAAVIGERMEARIANAGVPGFTPGVRYPPPLPQSVRPPRAEDRYCWQCGAHQSTIAMTSLCAQCGQPQVLLGEDVEPEAAVALIGSARHEEACVQRLLEAMRRVTANADLQPELKFEVDIAPGWFTWHRTVNGTMRDARVSVTRSEPGTALPNVLYATSWSDDSDPGHLGRLAGDLDVTVQALVRFLVDFEDFGEWNRGTWRLAK